MDPILSKLNFVEHLLLIVLAVLMMVSYGISPYTSTNSYLGLGKFMLSIVFFLVFQGLFRAGYIAFQKSKQKYLKAELSEFKPAIATERVVWYQKQTPLIIIFTFP